jgi:hypothetical protein
MSLNIPSEDGIRENATENGIRPKSGRYVLTPWDSFLYIRSSYKPLVTIWKA